MTNVLPKQVSSLWRERLIRDIDRSCQRRGAALIAGPGYGKTTLLAHFIGQARTPWVWCDLSEQRGDALSTIRYLVTEIEKRLPRTDRRQIMRLRDNRATIGDAIDVLHRFAAAHGGAAPSQLLVVFDDFQLTDDNTELGQCIAQFLESMAAGWKLLVASRREPSNPLLLKSILYGEMTLLAEDALAFTLDETKRFLELDRSAAIAAEQAAQIHAASAGWPAGVALLARHADSNAALSWPAPLIVDPLSFRRLAKSVLSDAGPALRAFMIRSAHLPFFDASLCDTVLGQTDSARFIELLIHRHLFLVTRHDQPGTYRFHALFRECLLTLAPSELGDDDIRALRHRAAVELMKRGFVEDAAEQFIEAEEWDGIAELFRTHGESLIRTGRTSDLLRWLANIPETITSQQPWLLLYRCRCSRLLDQKGDLRSLSRRAQSLFTRRGELVGRSLALLEEAQVAESDGEIAEASALCHEALNGLDQHPAACEVRSSLVTYHTMLGQFADSWLHGNAALTLLPTLEDTKAQSIYYASIKRRLGLTLAYAGDFHHSLLLLKEVCRLAEHDEIDFRTRVQSLHFLGFVEGMRGDFEAALQDLRAAERMAIDAGLGFHTMRIRATIAEIFTVIGQLDLAEREFRRANWFSDHMGDLGYFYFRSKRLDEAVEWYESLVARAGAASNPPLRSRSQAMLAVCLISLGNISAGKSLLEQAFETYRNLSFRCRTPGIALHLSDIAFQECRPGDGEALLRMALETAHEGGAYNFFALDPAVLSRSIYRAKEHGIELGYVSAIERRWLEALQVASEEQDAGSGATVSQTLPKSLLENCSDEQIRLDLLRIMDEGTLTIAGFQKLRIEYGLTWREVQVFARYYLHGPDSSSDPGYVERRRFHLAKELGVSELTLRQHINTIRAKLGKSGQSGLAIYQWSLSQGICRSTPRSSL